MNRFVRAATALVGCASLGACATVVRGTDTNWTVATLPSGATVDTTSGLHCASTPCTLRMSRRAEFVATVYKTGFEPENVHVTHNISAPGATALAGNLILAGGIAGLAVDLLDGAGNDLAPHDVALTLKPYFVVDPYAAMIPAPLFNSADAPYPAATVVADFPAPYPAPYSAQTPAQNPAQPLAEGRVIDFKLLADGEVQETRMRPN